MTRLLTAVYSLPASMRWLTISKHSAMVRSSRPMTSIAFQKLEQDIANSVTRLKESKGLQGHRVSREYKVARAAGRAGPAGADGAAAGLGCTTDQIIKWDDANGVWVCATDPFAGLNCDVGDQLRMGSGGWECRAEPITASLIQNSWEYSGGLQPITYMFDSLNNVETFTECYFTYCSIKVIGVADHSSCVTQVTGGAVSNALLDIATDSNDIEIGDTDTWNEGQAVYINISCTP